MIFEQIHPKKLEGAPRFSQKKNHICIWIQHSLLAETLWNKYAQSHFLVFLVFFFFLGSLQGFVSPKAPAAYVTPSPRILRSPSRCLAYHLATLYFLCWCCTLFYACLTLSESLLLASIYHSQWAQPSLWQRALWKHRHWNVRQLKKQPTALSFCGATCV